MSRHASPSLATLESPQNVRHRYASTTLTLGERPTKIGNLISCTQVITPMFVSATPGMPLVDHDGQEARGQLCPATYPAISEKDLLSLPFCPPDAATETAICDAVTNARHSRNRSSALLDAAKRAAEIAIEDDEAAALRFLDEQGD